MNIVLDGVFGLKWSLDRTRLSTGRNDPIAPSAQLMDVTEKDMFLALSLINAGSEHCKFLRSVTAYMSIRATRAWWQQFDQYRAGVQVTLSESTMKTITRRALVQEDFLEPINPEHLDFLNACIVRKDFDTVKNNLPEGFLQERGVCLNYQTLRNIYFQRRTHKLKEWLVFCKFIENIPYGVLICAEKEM